MTNFDDLLEQVSQAQDSMLAVAPSWCTESDLDNLRGITRLAVEFHYYFTNADMSDYDSLRYQCESAFSGANSFADVAAIYRFVGDHPKSSLVTSTESAKEDYLSRYRDFAAANGAAMSFAERCRILLDLFRLFIVFAATHYS